MSSNQSPSVKSNNRVRVDVDLQRHLELTLGKERSLESHYYMYRALALTLRDQMVEHWRDTRERYRLQKPRRVSYLSLEFLMGRSLNNALLNLGLDDEVHAALERYACELEELEREEPDAGLGNGGLGRLAACFLDSCASLEIPVTGYGLRYHYGMFHQQINHGYQIECPDTWLRNGNPWEIESPENTKRIRFYGRSEHSTGDGGRLVVRWVDTQDVLAVPYDTPVPGYHNDTVNTLRLWTAEATDEFNLEEFNAGGYSDAVAAKNGAEHITMVLYPNDQSEAGKELRLKQQYFLASASLQDVLHRWVDRNGEDFTEFAERNVFQLNDTHPTIAIAELMRLLLDDYDFEWQQGWDIITRTMAYTNHTLLPEALETWPVSLFETLLPRPLEIIREINVWFLERVEQQWPGDQDRRERMSIISGGDHPMVRMAYLAIVGSRAVNGVAALHTQLLEQGLFRDFYELWPEKFVNVTNGVTPRRWLSHCNPGLRDLLSESIGDGWVCNLDELEKLRPLADDAGFRGRFMAVKQANKAALAGLVEERCRVEFDPQMMFDVQVKRIHEYKRQLLNVLHLVHLYDRICSGRTEGLAPRCVLIGGKAAPGYFMAKLIIKLINNVAAVINGDSRARSWLRVAFLPDYGVSAMERICPGTDLSEQISTAGKEASGTGNMKFMMNGAVTIGTLDGANIEIRDAVGEDNFFLFGLNAEQVIELRADYDPAAIIDHDEDFSRVMKMLQDGLFNDSEPDIFDPVIEAIRNPGDLWMTAADFRSYVDAQHRAGKAFADREHWARMAVLNTASSGMFSSDRSIRQYRDRIWNPSRDD
ncbi:MAG: glycogen/starch/alpha-glucan phosphorylase [Gammaproteobacteria bacterium]|jgi:starch phosphorylase